MKFLLTTSESVKRFFITAPENRNRRYFITSGKTNRFFITRPENRNTRFFITASKINRFFITEGLAEEDYTCCKYPTWMMLYRQQATTYIYKTIVSLLSKSYINESYGKEDFSGYNLGLKLNSLLEYLTIISLRMREDENSGVDKTVEDYYTQYNLDCIIDYFKCNNINIKPLLTIFKIDTYTPSDYNFDAFDWAYNIDIEDEISVTTKPFRHYYTNNPLSPTSGEARSSLVNGQTSFTTTKTIKSITSFVINGNDKTDRVDFSGNTVTYTSGGTYPYTVQSVDTIILNYLYES